MLLATDPDREGEAIGWHLAELLGGSGKPIERVLFHEITKRAVQEAIAHPRPLDQHLVDSQQARRVLDRLVGYKLSPLLWDKVKRGLSGGPRAVGRAQDDLRPRGGDRSVRPRGVLAPRRPPGRRRSRRRSSCAWRCATARSSSSTTARPPPR